jgi:glycosyltransferase involved in cell wall biosynthesis
MFWPSGFMRIILLTQVVPNPPDSGPKIKTHNVLRYLAQHHEIHLVTFVRSDAEAAHAYELSEYCRAGVTTVPIRRSRVRDIGYLLRSLVTARPFLIERDDSRAMRQVLADLVSNSHYDAVHADQLSMAQFALDLPVQLHVLDEHNAVWTIVRRAAAHEVWYRRLPAELEWRKLKAYEGRVCREFDHVTLVSEDDRRDLEQATGSPFVSTVIPIAIDTDQLTFEDRTAEARHVLSVATMFYPPNVEGILWFAEHAFPRVRHDVPGTQFLVVGSRPPKMVTDLAQDGQRGLNVTGYVADLGPLLRQSALLVVPLHSGSGMRVKILEAFARGVPIVSTRVGVEGIDAQDDVHLLVADDPEAFAEAVMRLLRDHALGRRLAIAGRQLVEREYDWRTALRGLDNVYAGIDERQSAGVARVGERRSA